MWKSFTYGPLTPTATILALLLLLSACRRWEDPTANLPPRTAPELELLTHTDSLLATIAGRGAAERLDSVLRWTEYLRDFDQRGARTYAATAARWAMETDREMDQGIARFYLASLGKRQQLFGESMADAMVNAQMAYRLLNRHGDLRWRVLVNNLMGYVCYRQASPDYDSAQYYFQQALVLTEEVPGDDSLRAVLSGEILHGMGNVAGDQGQYERADSLYRVAETWHRRAANEGALRRLQRNRAGLAMVKRNWEEAAALLDSMLTSAQAAGDNDSRTEAYQQFGRLYIRKYRLSEDSTDFNRALVHLRRALAVQDENFYYTYDLMGWAFQSRSNREADQAFLVDSALYYYDLGLRSARGEGALSYFRNLAKSITSLCDWLSTSGTGDCQDILGAPTASYLNEQYSGVVDTITSDLAAANAQLMDFERRQQALNGRRRLRMTLLVAGFVLVLGAFVFMLVYQRKRRQEVEARLSALRAQINPHFFSNSLNAIESLVNLDQREAASKYLIHFSRLTRRILNSSLANTTSLAGELETARHFLSLEQLRFKDKLQYRIELDETVLPDEVEVPALILQPYIENAIWHGIKPKNEPGLLQLIVSRLNGQLVCTIEDDGIGRARSREQQARSVFEHKSVGMEITKERLVRAGGGRVEVVDLEDENGNAAGTRVIIRLPYKRLKS